MAASGHPAGIDRRGSGSRAGAAGGAGAAVVGRRRWAAFFFFEDTVGRGYPIGPRQVTFGLGFFHEKESSMPEGPEVETEKLQEEIREELEHGGGSFLKRI